MKSTILVREWSRWSVLALVLSVILAGCKDNGTTAPPAEGETVMELIHSNANLETLAGLLEGTTVEHTLSGAGFVTLFAPSDAAFEQLSQGYLQGLTIQQKLDILKYHVVSGSYTISNEIKRESILSLEGDKLFLEIGQSFGNLLNGKAKFVTTNIEADNGLIQIIDAVLLPDQYSTLGENLRKRYDYRTFYDRMEEAGMMAFIDTDGTKTIMAAPDLAVEALEGQLYMTLTEDQWQEIMEYHLLNQDITGAGPGTRTELTTLTGEAVYLTVDQPNQYMINGNEVNSEWIQSSNGNILFVPGVLLPDKYLDVLTLMGKRYYLSTFRYAFAVARLTGTLYNTEAEFTILAPLNDAEGINNWPTTEAELAEILKYHVLNEKRMTSELDNSRDYVTWQGSNISISRNGNAIVINGTANITGTDLVARNGVVHVLNNTLSLPAN